MEIDNKALDSYLSTSLGKPVIAFEYQEIDEWVEINVCEDMIPREMGLKVMQSASIATVTILKEELWRIMKRKQS